MNKKLQLKIMVFLCIIIVVFVYFYVSKGFSFKVTEDFENLKESIGINQEEILDLSIIKDIQDKLGKIKEQTIEEEDKMKSEITEKVLNQLNDQNNIIYGYEPSYILLRTLINLEGHLS